MCARAHPVPCATPTPRDSSILERIRPMTDFSYQLYSSRNFPPLADTLTMLAGLGYTGVEGYGGLYADAAKVDELRAHLGASGLRMPTAHFGLDMIEGEPDRVIAIARDLGIATVYCPYLLAEHRPGDGKGWEAFGRRLAAAGKPLRDAGLGFGWHNHDFEFRATPDGAIPQEAIFEGGPDLEWEADIAWVIKGGADPLYWIETFGPRITSVHVKDIAPAGQNADEDGWADVGHGTVDWKGLMAALRKTAARNFVMEHDNPKDAARFAARSLAAAKTF
jgi:sugar phosphate isomerase/epimerase